MNRKCYRLQSQDVWLGLSVDKLFNTKKEAEMFFHTYCMGIGIISKVRATAENTKFYPSMDVTERIIVKILGVKE